MTDLANTIQEFWNTYYPIVLSIGGTVMVVGGMVMTFYLKFKPLIDKIKEKFTSIEDSVKNPQLSELESKMKASDLNVKITDLEEKINNPLTSESARKIYTQEMKFLIEIRAGLDTATEKVEDTSSKF